MQFLNLDKNGFDRFISTYTNAVANNQDTFTFEGHTLVTQYAKYLIEYYTQQIKSK